MCGALLAVFAAAPSLAQNRGFCAEPPERNSAACTLGGGEVMIEVTTLSFDLSYDPVARNETLTLADTLLRVGIDDATEIQLGVAALVEATSRDRVTGARDQATGMGDSYIAIRRGVSSRTALELYVTLPTGKGAASAGDWGAGLLLPLDLPAPDGFTFSLIPEVSAAPNASGAGRHFLVGGVAGMSHALSGSVAAGLELGAFHDDDPDGAALIAQLTGSLAWQVSPRLQLNAESDFGVAHGEPRASFFVGFALGL